MTDRRKQRGFEQKEAKLTKGNGAGVSRWSFDKIAFDCVTLGGLGFDGGQKEAKRI